MIKYLLLLPVLFVGCCNDDSLIKERYIPMLQSYIAKDEAIDADMKDVHQYALRVWLGKE